MTTASNSTPAAPSVVLQPMVQPWVQVQWLGDRRLKLWAKLDDPSDPLHVNGLSGGATLPRNQLLWINLQQDPFKS